jgi:hypothetical protein
MYTFGGMFLENQKESEFNTYNFLNKNFISEDETVVNISFPIITDKEFHLLNGFLPDTTNTYDVNPELTFIPEKHRTTYKNVYLYYPSFHEISHL